MIIQHIYTSAVEEKSHREKICHFHTTAHGCFVRIGES
jgi:hypothetical protein